MKRDDYIKNKKITINFGWIFIIFILTILIFSTGYYYFNKAYTYNIYNQKNVEKNHRNFINKLLPSVNDAQRKYGILASISLAQAVIESDWGTSQLAMKYNNLYGIKAFEGQPSVKLSTNEFVNGNFIKINGNFRVYKNWDESVQSHARLLFNGTNWNRNQYQDVVNSDNYVAAAEGLQIDGYATDPKYTKKIIETIKRYHLNQYDKT
ncbi:glycoside hydrolase family 73 protein [Apilactobacillus apisilvae]|uniref:Glycoside hydrolase family 73 protein n=1 Tax=Apilactobacillus apisilvae TaxID=2923364 RepID=A0ABY4PJE9_9LACO|nr:glycoside hydrolase family 73 protein [Apilactobacillus apisilvae]UQS85599.1 glycoside hydrolase family 73 protein [Apilactobacillus apisilvae]